jgi:hypothetical protein
MTDLNKAKAATEGEGRPEPSLTTYTMSQEECVRQHRHPHRIDCGGPHRSAETIDQLPSRQNSYGLE